MRAQFGSRSSRYTGRVEGHTKTREIIREITTYSAEETIAFGRTLAALLVAAEAGAAAR